MRPLLTKLGVVTRSKTGGVKIAWREIGITAVLVATLTVLLLPRLQLQTRTLAIGDIAPADIKAHTDFLLEDEVSAQKKRKEAEDRVLPLYDYDQRTIEAIDQRLKGAMQIIESAYRGHPPVTRRDSPGGALSSPHARRSGAPPGFVWRPDGDES